MEREPFSLLLPEASSSSAPRRSPAAMDSGQRTSIDHAPLAAVAQPRCSAPGTPELLDDASSVPQCRQWADLPPDILGVVTGNLTLMEDHARLRSVCRSWRVAARLHRRPPPPLPLLLMSDFSFCSFNAGGTTLTGALRRVPLPETETKTGVHCVGSIDGWLVAVDCAEDSGDLRCFLINAFSHGIIDLPSPSSATPHTIHDERTKLVPVTNGGGSGVVMNMNCTINATAQCDPMSFCKVVLSSSPELGTGFIVAAISMANDTTTKLALWRPGMKSWCVCTGGCVGKFIDVIFCQGKLYMLSSSEFTTDFFYLDISEDDDTGLMVSGVVSREIEWPEVKDGYHQNWSIAEWHGKLIVVATYTDDADVWQRFDEVRVFEADLSAADPVRFTEIKSLDGDSIFISPCSSKVFGSSQYDGVEGDRVYFIDGYLAPEKDAHPFYKFVYNMRDGSMTPFAGDVPREKLQAADGILMNPTWLFPTE